MTLRFFRSALLILLLGVTGPAFAETPMLEVSIDHGVEVSLDAPAASVFIANPAIADIQVLSPTEVMVFGKMTGETTLMATDNDGHTLLHRTVVVNQDLSDLRRALDDAIPGNKIHAEAVPNGIVMTGETHDPSVVEDAIKIAMHFTPKGGDVINRIEVNGSNQINLRVRFAEVSRKVDNTLGIDWDSAASYGGMAFGIASGAAFYNASNSPTITRPNNTTLTEPNDTLSFQHAGQRTNINSILDALAQEGLVTILAEPNLTAMSGETAYFLAGGEFPIPIPQSSGNGGTTITVQFKDYGVSLAFTPTLIGNNRINLHVKPEVSQLTETGAINIDNITVPALTTRRAETTVELASGQSFAIGGLLDNEQAQTINKFPELGDMPIIGPLFRSSEFQNNQSELVIVVTPYIVRPSDKPLSLPTDGLTPPSEVDRLLKNRTIGSDPGARPVSGAPQATLVVPPDAPVTPPPVTSNINVAPPAFMPAAANTHAPASSPAKPVPAAQVIIPAPGPAPDTPLVIHNFTSGEAPDNGPPAKPSAPAADNPVAAPAKPDGFILE